MTDGGGHGLLDLAEAWLQDGRQIAIATVVRTWGSAPRPAGSQLIIRDDGLFEGSVSGGCVEGAVIAAAGEVMQTKQTKHLAFGVSDQEAWNAGLACGGRIEVLIEPVL